MRRSLTVLSLVALSLAAPARAEVPPSYAGELALARQLAQAGGDKAMRYRGKVKTEYKDGHEVVTAADREISADIILGIKQRYPHDLVITEEDKSNWWKLRFARRVWFIDPIDGTEDFVKGHDGFAVQIGLVEKPRLIGCGKAVVGVVYQPAADRMMFAAPGVGARIIEAGRERALKVSSTRDPAALRLIVSNSHRTAGTDSLKAALGITAEVPMGSVGVKLGYIARAEQDLTFKDNSSAKVWDIAAPQAILEAAGGRFTSMTGQAFNYNRIQTRGGILATNGVSHDEVVRRASAVLHAKSRR